ncbi:hypothetical protein Tco_0674864 [Tanacetum coccineum]
MADGEIDNLTMEQDLALTRGNQAPGVVVADQEVYKGTDSSNHKTEIGRRLSVKSTTNKEFERLQERILGGREWYRKVSKRTDAPRSSTEWVTYSDSLGAALQLRDNTFSGMEHEDANEHIEKVLEIVDLFHIPKVTQDQIMLRAFPVSLTGAASMWLRN